MGRVLLGKTLIPFSVLFEIRFYVPKKKKKVSVNGLKALIKQKENKPQVCSVGFFQTQRTPYLIIVTNHRP